MTNLLDPAILFFILGAFAGLVRSNLEIPPAIAKFLSLYLLMALGLKGGFALHATGINADVASAIGAAVLLAFVIPALGYLVLRRWLGGFDAAAIAAAYGSVSAVTFVTAMAHLESRGISYGGHMPAAMVAMESPAVIMAVLLANVLRRQAASDATVAAPALSLRKVLHESFTEGAQVLLLGAMLVGYLTGDAGKAAMQPFSGDLFKGMLCFFLLDMGLLVARNFASARQAPPVLIGYGLLAPLAHAGLALLLARLLGLGVGDSALLMTLAASASYIVVPAVLRYAMPEANPSLYFGLSLGITFPFNILIGISLYATLAQRFAG